jgi:hypothetical protein
MADPIANDWQAIRDRMQQIQAERSASLRPCAQCNGRGWIPDLSGAQRAYAVGFGVCDRCHNPKHLPYPTARRQGEPGRGL